MADLKLRAIGDGVRILKFELTVNGQRITNVREMHLRMTHEGLPELTAVCRLTGLDIDVDLREAVAHLIPTDEPEAPTPGA